MERKGNESNKETLKEERVDGSVVQEEEGDFVTPVLCRLFLSSMVVRLSLRVWIITHYALVLCSL